MSASSDGDRDGDGSDRRFQGKSPVKKVVKKAEPAASAAADDEVLTIRCI